MWQRTCRFLRWLLHWHRWQTIWNGFLKDPNYRYAQSVYKVQVCRCGRSRILADVLDGRYVVLGRRDLAPELPPEVVRGMVYLNPRYVNQEIKALIKESKKGSSCSPSKQ